MNKDWKTYRFSELYKVSSGLSKSAKEFGFGFPFLSFSDVFWNYFIPNELDQLVNSSDSEQNTCSVKKGDVFLTRTSETVDELGMSCVALKDYPRATFNGFTKRLRPKSHKVIDPIFIGYYLRSPYFRGEITAYSTLTTRASLNNGIIEKLSVKLPNLLEQQKVSSVLFSYDQLIKNNTKRISILEQMAEQLYKEWFVRMRFPNYENTNYENGIPSGWRIKKANDIYDINIGKTPPRNQPKWFTTDKDAVKWASIRDINASTVFLHDTNERITKEGVLKHNMRLAPKGTVILSFKLTVGKVAICSEDILSNEAIAHFNIKKEYEFIGKEYTYLFLKNFRYGELGNTSSIGNAINSKIVKGMPVILPSEELLLEFSKKLTPVFDSISNLNFQIRNLKKTRDLLLPRLISGKLKIE